MSNDVKTDTMDDELDARTAKIIALALAQAKSQDSVVDAHDMTEHTASASTSRHHVSHTSHFRASVKSKMSALFDCDDGSLIWLIKRIAGWVRLFAISINEFRAAKQHERAVKRSLKHANE